MPTVRGAPGVKMPGNWHWTADSQIRAVVSAAPGVSYAFTPESLASIHIPVQLWQAEYDHVLPAPYYVDPVRKGLPSPPEFHRVIGADHFDFLPPCLKPEDVMPQRLHAGARLRPGRVSY